MLDGGDDGDGEKKENSLIDRLKDSTASLSSKLFQNIVTPSFSRVLLAPLKTRSMSAVAFSEKTRPSFWRSEGPPPDAADAIVVVVDDDDARRRGGAGEGNAAAFLRRDAVAGALAEEDLLALALEGEARELSVLIVTLCVKTKQKN